MNNEEHIKENFTRKSIKSRMLDLAAQSHGYEQFELDSFDPLVDLLLSALAKELEKSHYFFEDSFDHLLDHITDRLIPQSYLDFNPSFGVVQTEAMDYDEVNQENFKCFFLKEIDKKKKEINFVPLCNMPVNPNKVKLIADGNKLFSFKDLNKTTLTEYKANNSSIYIGVNYKEAKEGHSILPLFFSWFSHPKAAEFNQVLKNSTWSIQGKEVKPKFGLDELVDQQEFNKFWQKDSFQNKFSELCYLVGASYFHLDINEKIHVNEDFVPHFIKDMIKDKPELAYANDLMWIEINLPHLPICAELAKNVHAQTNCIPVINMNEQFETHKIRKPFKIIRISDQEFFVDIKRIENYNNEIYIPKHQLDQSDESVIGHYIISRESILRLDKRSATEQILRIIDLIREERNAFSSFNPDWIIDELENIKINIKRIEHKLGDNLKISPNDVFVKLEDQESESLLRVEYWTCNGEEANDLVAGSIGELNSSVNFHSSNCLILETTQDGKQEASQTEKLSKFKQLLNTRNRLVTREDIRLSIEHLILPLTVDKIEFEDCIDTKPGFHTGYLKYKKIKIQLAEGDYDIQYLNRLLSKIQQHLDKYLISDLLYKVEFVKSQAVA